MTSTARLCLTLFLGLCLGRLPFAAAGTAHEIVIGVLYPMSGPAAQVGVDNKAAIEVALDLINHAHDLQMPLAKTAGLPNLGHAKVRAIFSDHQGKPDVGQGEAERLITQEKVVALYGAWHSAVTRAIAQVAEHHGVPMVNGDSSAPALTEEGLTWLFRTSPHDGQFTQAMFSFFKAFEQQRGITLKTLGLTYEDTLFGVGSGNVTKALAAQHGYDVVLDLQYRARAPSLAAEVQRLKAAHPDVWMPTSYQTDAILFTKSLKALDYTPKMIMAQDAGHLAPDFLQAVGKEAEGTMTRAPFAADLIPKLALAQHINERYKKHHGMDLYDFPARAFTGFLTLVEAIDRAGSTAPAAIRQALQATDIPPDQLIMPWDGVRFDDKGQNVRAKAIILQLQGGHYHTVWPFHLATKEVLYPIPPWSARQ